MGLLAADLTLFPYTTLFRSPASRRSDRSGPAITATIIVPVKDHLAASSWKQISQANVDRVGNGERESTRLNNRQTVIAYADGLATEESYDGRWREGRDPASLWSGL